MAAQAIGIITIIWQAKQIDCEKGSSFSAGGLMNTPVIAGRKLFASQEFKNGLVEAVTVFTPGQSLTGLYIVTPGELQVQCDTGQVFTWAQAVQIGDPPKVTGGDGGKVTLQWAVDVPQELLST